MNLQREIIFSLAYYVHASVNIKTDMKTSHRLLVPNQWKQHQSEKISDLNMNNSHNKFKFRS